MVSIYAFIASILYILIANFLLNKLNGFNFNSDRYEIENSTFGPNDLLAQVTARRVDQFCRNLTKDDNSTQKCFHVNERFVVIDGRRMLFRGFRYEGGIGSRISDAHVIIPNPLKFSDLLNSSLWQIDKRGISMDYARLMVSGVFFSGAVQYNSSVNHNILLIGLRGGAINNYLSTMTNQKFNITVVDSDPMMKMVAEKWYGFEETELHRIIVEDIDIYVQDASREGEKFNVILVDLCANERRPLICPSADSLKSNIVENLPAILADGGTVIVRILTGMEFPQGPEEANTVRRLFEKYFEGCTTMTEGRHQMMFCFDKVEASENKTDALYKMRELMETKLDFNFTDETNY